MFGFPRDSWPRSSRFLCSWTHWSCTKIHLTRSGVPPHCSWTRWTGERGGWLCWCTSGWPHCPATPWGGWRRPGYPSGNLQEHKISLTFQAMFQLLTDLNAVCKVFLLLSRPGSLIGPSAGHSQETLSVTTLSAVLMLGPPAELFTGYSARQVRRTPSCRSDRVIFSRRVLTLGSWSPCGSSRPSGPPDWLQLRWGGWVGQGAKALQVNVTLLLSVSGPSWRVCMEGAGAESTWSFSRNICIRLNCSFNNHMNECSIFSVDQCIP